MNERMLHELLYQALETELGGVQVYTAAVASAVNDDLKEEWNKYLEETTRHVEIVQDVLQKVGLDPSIETPGRAVVRHLGQSLVQAIEQARSEAPGESAELVAAECVVIAETKDHQNWGLIGELIAAEHVPPNIVEALKIAFEEVEEQEDEHLYHTMGWARELWIQALGLPAVLPPPEEQRHVVSAMGAAHAKADRDEMLSSS